MINIESRDAYYGGMYYKEWYLIGDYWPYSNEVYLGNSREWIPGSGQYNATFSPINDDYPKMPSGSFRISDIENAFRFYAECVKRFSNELQIKAEQTMKLHNQSKNEGE